MGTDDTKPLSDLQRLSADRRELLQIAAQLVQIDDADKSGKPLVSCQGQGMDGFSKFANFEAVATKAREVLRSVYGREQNTLLGRNNFGPEYFGGNS